MHTLLMLVCILAQDTFDRRTVAYRPEQEAPAAAVDVTTAEPPTVTPAAALPVNIEWSTTTAAANTLTSHDITTTENWLVSESWCTYCPAARAKFLAEGNPSSRVIDIATARQMGEMWSGSVPHRFSRQIVRTVLQPPSYRSEWPPRWTLNGDRSPSKGKLLNHLRNDSQHRGKHWQEWYLESWSREQLSALHSDDHNNRVPMYSEPETAVTATVDTVPTVNVVAVVLAAHLDDEQPTTSSLINIDVDAPETALEIARKLLIDQRWESDSISATWEGGDRTISVGANRLSVTPGVAIVARKSILKVSTKLTGVSYDDGLTFVTLELSGVPDLTIRFR